MPATVDDIDRQIQKLIQQKKRVSDAQNLNTVGSSHNTTARLSSQSTTSKGWIPNAAGKVENRSVRGHSGHYKGMEATTTTKPAS